MNRIRIAAAALLAAGLLAGLAPPADAQEEEGRSTAALTIAGVAGGAAGLVGGFYLGALAADDEDDDDLDQIAAGLVGAAIGEALFLPLGVHLANREQGSYPRAALVSLGLAAAGVVALGATHFDRPWAPAILVVVPIGQLASSIAIERRTAD